MWYRAPYCWKSALLMMLTFCSLLDVRADYGSQQKTEQHPPINKIRLVGALKAKTLPPSTLIEEILSYGVDFDLNLVEAELRAADADDALIQAVRDSKLCDSVDEMIIAVVNASEHRKNAYDVYTALKKIRCPVLEPKPPSTPPKIYKNSKPKELRYFSDSDLELAKGMADYIKRMTKVELIPVRVNKPLSEAMPKPKSDLEIYFLF